MNLFGLRAKPVDKGLGPIKDQFDHEGFAVLGGFFPPEFCDRVLREVDLYTGPARHSLASWITVDILHGDHRGRLVRAGDAPDAAFTGPFKVNNLFTESEVVAEAVFSPRLAQIMGGLLGADPVAINSLNFRYGSQQPDHIDTWYMPPPKAGSLIVASTCLEDVRPDAGPLFYYPGSHRIPPYVFSHGGIHAVDAEMPACRRYLEGEIAKRNLKKEIFLGKKGDVFLWHCQLVHGGSPISDLAKTRASLVVHYWGVDAMGGDRMRISRWGGKFQDRDYWRTDGKEIETMQSDMKQSTLAGVTPQSLRADDTTRIGSPIKSVATKHVAFETWEARGESLESVEARIHDGVPAKHLRQRAAGYLETLDALFPESRPRIGSRLMEIGSGVGYVLEEALRRYKPASIVGLDIAAGMIEHAKQRLHRDGVDASKVEFIHYDGVDVPLPDASIDHIYSVASLQHAPRPYCFRAMMEAWRLLRPGGAACIHLLAYSHFRDHMTLGAFQQELLQQIRENAGHWHHYYTVEELESVLRHGVGVSAECIALRQQLGSVYLSCRKP